MSDKVAEKTIGHIVEARASSKALANYRRPRDFSTFSKEKRDKFGSYDFTIICDDGKVNCHYIILALHSESLTNMINDIGNVREMTLNHSVKDVEEALDYVYGLSAPSSKEKRVTLIPLRLYNVMRFFEIHDLTHHSFYRSHFHDIDVVKDFELGSGEHKSRCDPEFVLMVMTWLLEHESRGPKELIYPLRIEMCRIAATFSRDAGVMPVVKEMMMKLSIDTIRIIFEEHNSMIYHIGVSEDWRLDFIKDYINDDNYVEVGDLLLTRISMVMALTNNAIASNIFGLSSKAEELMEFQLRSGYFYSDCYASFDGEVDGKLKITMLSRRIDRLNVISDTQTIMLDKKLMPFVQNAQPTRLVHGNNGQPRPKDCVVM